MQSFNDSTEEDILFSAEDVAVRTGCAILGFLGIGLVLSLGTIVWIIWIFA